VTRPHPPAFSPAGTAGSPDAPLAPLPVEASPPSMRRPSTDGLGYLVATMRWCGVAIGLVISGANGDLGRPSTIAAGLLVTSGCLWYTLWPVRLSAHRPLAVAAFASDLAVIAAAVGITGAWKSPFVLLLLATVLVAGFDRGYVAGFAVVGACSAAVALPAMIGHAAVDHAGVDVAAPVVLVLIATAAVAGYAHRLFVEADQHHHETTGELLRLAQFNQQLLVLYQMAQTLPASLDLDETLEEARRHLDEAIELDVFAVLTTDEGGSGWTVAASSGATLPDRLTEAALPSVARAALLDPAGLLVDDLGSPERGPGLDPRSRTAVYVGLRAGGRVVGLLAIERRRPVAFTVPALRLVHGIADSLSLGIENARWFRRLRSLGAEEERTRIARELHDRLAQSLVYLGYELDRLVKRRERDDELARLRDEVRMAVTELRETLVQLRSTVNAEHPLEVHVRQLAERFTRRTGVAVDLELRPVTPLPPRVDQEVLRILQEALNNVERHAGATRVVLGWSMDHGRVRFVVEDDGRGFDPDVTTARSDAFGLVGMSERADVIGARLRVERSGQGGTCVSLEVDARHAERAARARPLPAPTPLLQEHAR
jgi:signal transduction histidine kinase